MDLQKSERALLYSAIIKFRTEQAEVFIPETIKPSNERYHSAAANEEFAKEMATLIERGTFDFVIKEDLWMVQIFSTLDLY